MGAQKEGLLVFGLKLFLNKFGPKRTSSSQFRNLHVKVHANSKEERNTGCNLVNRKASGLGGTDVLNTVGKSKRKLEFTVSAGLLHMVA